MDELSLNPHGRPDAKRSILVNTETGKKEIESPVRRDSQGQVIGPPHLIICLDQGSVGFPASLYLYQKLGIQGWWVHDPFHRMWNDIKNGFTGAGMWPVCGGR